MDVRYNPDSHAVMNLLENTKASLFGTGEYRLEVPRRKLTRVKLRERDQKALAVMEDELGDAEYTQREGDLSTEERN